MSGCRKTALWGLALLVAAIGFVWWMWFPSYTYRQKITLTVEANGQEYSASSVTAVTWQYGPPLLVEIKRATATLEGEAVHLELPGGKHLFAVLQTKPAKSLKWNGVQANMAGLASYVFPEAVTQLYWPSDMKKLRETRALPNDLPLVLATFADLAQPLTVREVDPRNLAATFGAGVRLKSTTLAITDEPVGPGTILAVLPWLPEYQSRALDGDNHHRADAPNKFANSLGGGEFSTRRFK